MSKKLTQIQRFDQRSLLGSPEGMELSPPHLVHSTWDLRVCPREPLQIRSLVQKIEPPQQTGSNKG